MQFGGEGEPGRNYIKDSSKENYFKFLWRLSKRYLKKMGRGEYFFYGTLKYEVELKVI